MEEVAPPRAPAEYFTPGSYPAAQHYTPNALLLLEHTVEDSDSQVVSAHKYPGLQAFSAYYAGLHGYIAAVVCIWGTAANMANIVVLTRPKMLSSTNLILTWLAVADLLTMISCLPVNIHFYIMKDPKLPFPSTRTLDWIRYLIFNINFTVACHTVAIWLTITLAIFRYLYICYPTSGASLCSMQKARSAIIAVYASTAIVCIPNYLVPEIETLTDNKNNATAADNETSVYYTVIDKKSVFNTINYWIQAFLFKLIPCILLTILTVLLVIAMHQANVRRMKLKSQGRRDESDRAREHNRTTAMLLAVVGLFLITELPQGVLTLGSIFVQNFFQDVYWPLGDLLDIMALLNNSINFVLYCTMSRQFRETFVEIFCACQQVHPPGWLKLEVVTQNTLHLEDGVRSGSKRGRRAKGERDDKVTF